MDNQINLVQDFFNEISSDYNDKYTPKQEFLNYFFGERLLAATDNFNFKNKTILDIGAGTGKLFDKITSIEPNQNYYAVDIAQKMLENSNIPKSNWFVGDVWKINELKKVYDFIYLLGVTTYLPTDILNNNLKFITDNLESSNGNAIVTITNKYSLDNFFRKIFSIPLMLFFRNKTVISQPFKKYKYSKSEFEKIINDFNLNIDNEIYLSQSVFPFSRLMPKFSIKVAKFCKTKIKNKIILSLLSTDILLVIKKNKSN